MAANMLVAQLSLKGTRPLLWHRFGPEALSGERKERTGSAGNDPEEWRRTVLATPEGQLYVEPTYAFAVLREGAKFTKKGQSNLQKSLSATLQVLGERILLNRFWPGFPNRCRDARSTASAPRDLRRSTSPPARSWRERARSMWPGESKA